MSDLIPTPSYLLTLNEYEVAELLIDGNYNKQELREIIKHLVKSNKDYRDAFIIERNKNKRIGDELY